MPSPQTTKSVQLAAPVGGMNALSGLAQMSPQDAIYMYNILPTELGARTRLGYREWANGLGNEVRTLIPFKSNVDGADRLFAVTEDEIWDVTNFDTAPTSMVSFTFGGIRSGFGVYLNFTSPAEDQYIYYADEANGLFLYDDSLGTWAQATDFTAQDTDIPPPAVDIVFIMQHKLRMWFVGRDQTNVWYLEPGSFLGGATQFVLNGKYKHGGKTMGLWNWTMDGGDGVDDYLLVASKSGDIVTFRGSDPASGSTWDNPGTYFVTELTNSRRVTAEYGGELYILCSLGLISFRDLLSGVDPIEDLGSPSYKIQRLVREEVQKGLDSYEWEILIDPTDGSLHINVPVRNNPTGNYWQFVMDLSLKSWGIWRDVPIVSSETWKGQYFFGTTDGRIYSMLGSHDDTRLDGTPGEPVRFSMLTSFQDMGEPSVYKRSAFIRPMGLITDTVTLDIKPVYDYAVQTVVSSPSSPTTSDTLSAWDAALWDSGTWEGEEGRMGQLYGGSGMGVNLAIAMSGVVNSQSTLVAWDVMWNTGGLL